MRSIITFGTRVAGFIPVVARDAASGAPFTRSVARRIPKRGIPRRSRRGLGLLDVTLALGVLSLLMLWGSGIVTDWTNARIVQGEARMVSDLARAGRLLVQGDVTHAGRRLAAGTVPRRVQFSELQAAGLRAPMLGNRTPGRRDLTLWLYRPTAGALIVIARARGTTPIPRLPGAEDGVSGVGVLTGTSGTNWPLRGPGVDFDMVPLNRLTTGFATVNDLFALDYVALGVTCHAYLYRRAVDCDGDGTTDPAANTMATGLDMGGNNLTGMGAITATTANIGTLADATRITNDLTVAGDLTVGGDTETDDLEVNGELEAANITTTGTLSARNLTATGQVTGKDLSMTGTVTVSGNALLGDAEMETLTVSDTARLGKANVETLSVNTLNVRQLSSDQGDFDAIYADDITTTRCSGCR